MFIIFIYVYLNQLEQKIKLGSTSRTLLDELMSILFGIPQGSISRPLLFIIYFLQFLYFQQSPCVCQLANDTTPFVCREGFGQILGELEKQMV